MTTTNRLTAKDTVTDGDQFPVWATNSGDTRRVAASAIKAYVQKDFEPAGGLLGISSIYAIRITTTRVLAVGTAYQNVPNYESSVTLPSTASSVTPMLVVGELVATRDIQGVQFWAGLTGTWPTNRDLTVAVLVGPDSGPFESAFRFVGAGRGVGAPMTATISGVASNLNDPQGFIRAGQKIRLVVKFSVADNLSIDRLSFAIQTLDGQ